MKGIKIIAFVCVAAILLLLVDYQGALLNTKFYVEPAENESLVLLQSESFASKALSVDSYYDEGIIPIYPFGYYTLANVLFEDLLASLRFLNIVFFWTVTVSAFVVAYLRTRRILFSSYLSLLLYGVSKHSVYFFMARPDGIYVGFGVLAILLFTLKLQNEHIKLVGIALLTSLSILSKQTGLFFGMFISLIFILEVFTKNRDKNQTKPFITYITCSTLAAGIIFYLNKASYFSFVAGFDLYGSAFSYSHVYLQILDLFRHYWWLVCYVLLMLVTLYKTGNIKSLISHTILWIFCLLVSIKLWSNNAAHHNNYILVTICFYLTAIDGYNHHTKRGIYHFLLICGLFTSHVKFSGMKVTFPLQERVHRIEANGKIENFRIFNYIKNHDGEYITARADNLLYYNDKNISYEASVFDNLVANNPNSSFHSGIEKKVDEIRSNIADANYQGVITGINGLMESNYPNLRENYKILYRDKIQCGDWPHFLTLWIKK